MIKYSLRSLLRRSDHCCTEVLNRLRCCLMSSLPYLRHDFILQEFVDAATYAPPTRVGRLKKNCLMKVPIQSLTQILRLSFNWTHQLDG